MLTLLALLAVVAALPAYGVATVLWGADTRDGADGEVPGGRRRPKGSAWW